MKLKKNAHFHVPRCLASLLVGGATVWTVVVTAGATSPDMAVEAVRQESRWAVPFLRWELGDLTGQDTLSHLTVLAMQEIPLLLAARQEVAAVWAADIQQRPASDSEDDEGSLLVEPPPEEPPAQEPASDGADAPFADNGAPARTLRPTDGSNYTVSGTVYVNNGTDYTLDPAVLDTTDFESGLTADAPQILIVHTHGTEAYTMPPGQAYESSDSFRTTDTAYNMIRVGDELAAVLAQAGLSVLHDRSLYDYPAYSGAYTRSLASIEQYLAQYPSIRFVLDVHRDAIADAAGVNYKVVSAEDPHAAQIEIVVGSGGSGLPHDRWRENLRFAAAVQRTAASGSPTLMRPIIVRNARYNQHMTTGSLLVEIGAAGNSLEEALCAARLFGGYFAKTLQE